jgi:Tol biopolymer transport system component
MSLGGGGRRTGPGLATWVLVAVLGLLAGLGLAAYLALPRLTQTFPRAGAQFMSSRAPVRLIFNRPMDHASVESAFTVTPARPGSFAWSGQTLTFIPAEPWPLSSTVTVNFTGGRSLRGLPLLGAINWSFGVGERRLAYLSSGAVPNLWLTTVGADAAPQAVTTETVGVYDYAISPDGTQIAYSARSADGGDELRLLRLDGSGAIDLVKCPGEACVSPAFSPDGQKLAYERHVLVSGLSGAQSLGPAHVHLYDLTSRADQTVSDADTRFPRWGPDGRLAFLDTGRQAVVVQDLASGALTYIPDTSGEMGTWSPDGKYITYPEIIVPPEPTPNATPSATPNATPNATPDATQAESEAEQPSNPFYSYLLRVTIATNESVNLSGSSLYEDASPVYSPSGAWLAFGRKQQIGGQWTPGRQLWLMRADGNNPRPLTDDPLYNQSAFTWSSDGAVLAYMRFNTNNPGEPAEIWQINIDEAGTPGSGAAGARRLTQGYLPEWLP